jgi:membrane protein
MRTALNATFKAKPVDEPIFSLIRSRAASLGLVAALGFMLIVSLVASAPGCRPSNTGLPVRPC